MTDKWNNITKCPICDGDIQATLTERSYYSGTVIAVRDDGVWSVESDGFVEDTETDSFDPYCENDHSIDEMLSHLFPEGK